MPISPVKYGNIALGRAGMGRTEGALSRPQRLKSVPPVLSLSRSLKGKASGAGEWPARNCPNSHRIDPGLFPKIDAGLFIPQNLGAVHVVPARIWYKYHLIYLYTYILIYFYVYTYSLIYLYAYIAYPS